MKNDLTNLNDEQIKTAIKTGSSIITIYDLCAFGRSQELFDIEDISDEEYDRFTKKNVECEILTFYSGKRIIIYIESDDDSIKDGFYMYSTGTNAFEWLNKGEKAIAISIIQEYDDFVEGSEIARDFIIKGRMFSINNAIKFLEDNAITNEIPNENKDDNSNYVCLNRISKTLSSMVIPEEYK